MCSVPSEIGRPVFPITSSEASNGCQRAIKLSFCGCEYMNLSISSVFHQHYFPCLHKQQGWFFFFFKLPEVHSETCFTFKRLCHSQNIEVTITCCSAPASRQSSAVIQEEKTTRYMVYLRIYGSCHLKFTAYTRQNPKHGNGKQIVFLLLWNRYNLSAWEHTALQFYVLL